MRFRTLALALALVFGSGALSTVHAAEQNKALKKRSKELKKLNKQRAKNSNAAKYKPRKGAKTKKNG
jgi:3-hydroxy-3-methylglutaryl CoA synthase